VFKIFKKYFKFIKQMKKRIAFDIDDTLIFSKDGSINTKVFDIMTQYKNKNNTLFIITAREGLYRNDTIEELKKYKIDKFIPLDKNLYFTNGLSKIQCLTTLDIDEFYDDDQNNINDVVKAVAKGKMSKNFILYKINSKGDPKHIVL
jgi:uncharacterized HAD superfamily protein